VPKIIVNNTTSKLFFKTAISILCIVLFTAPPYVVDFILCIFCLLLVYFIVVCIEFGILVIVHHKSSESCLIKSLPYISCDKYIYILVLEMASPGNPHCANCIGTLSFPIYTSLFA